MFDYLPKGKWWDRGLSLVEGCTKISPGCDHCWSLTAAQMRRFNPNNKLADRFEDTVWENPCCHPEWTGQVNLQWPDLPKIGAARQPQVYTFWNDLFHPGMEEEFVTSIMLRILSNLQHFYIICTKRPERALEYFQLCLPDYIREFGRDPFQSRLMLMTTAENQKWADRRLPILLQIPGVLHGVSYEPALGPVSFNPYLNPRFRQESGYRTMAGDPPVYYLDWLIAGGETGPGARPSHPDWFRQARDQAVAGGVPFFFKGWGEWEPLDSCESACAEAGWGNRKDLKVLWPNGVSGSALLGNVAEAWHEGCRGLKRLGKKAAGRRLDGREWNEVPHV